MDFYRVCEFSPNNLLTGINYLNTENDSKQKHSFLKFKLYNTKYMNKVWIVQTDVKILHSNNSKNEMHKSEMYVVCNNIICHVDAYCTYMYYTSNSYTSQLLPIFSPASERWKLHVGNVYGLCQLWKKKQKV